jgi:AraC family transcriptional regulator
MSQLISKEIYSGPLVSIRDVRCRPANHECSGEEYAETPRLVFPRSGVFLRHVRGQKIVAVPAQVLFFNGDEEYRVSHPVPGGDDCTVFEFSPEVMREALRLYEPDLTEVDLKAPFRITHSAVENHTVLRVNRLSSRSPSLRPLAIEESALGILHDALDNARRGRRTVANPKRPGTVRSRRELVEEIKLLLAARPGEDWSLALMARKVNASPFHLARIFRAHVGVSVHQYLLRLRLSAALEQMRCGADDLNRLAAELGFSSHSHFSTLFRKAFGISPSEHRRGYSKN